MTDDKRKRGKADRAKISAKQTYEIAFVAKKFGVTRALVREVIKLVGPSRRKLYAAVEAVLKHA